jgi:hypothetical protein
VVVPSLDGHVYVVDGRTRCTRRVDIGRSGAGEHMYAQVGAPRTRRGRPRCQALARRRRDSWALYSVRRMRDTSCLIMLCGTWQWRCPSLIPAAVRCVQQLANLISERKVSRHSEAVPKRAEL